jgi:ABC-type oligopeptide transport system substrate-binding subunit
LLQQVNNQLVHDFLSQQNTRLLLFLSEQMDLYVAGRDQSAADQPNNLAEGHPSL